jgi:3',5'-nucleoside bisphosphate phosphatase
MTATGRADLHLHTRCSDGSYEPRELVRLAHDLGFTVIAVTDHDTMAGVDDAVSEGLSLGVRVIAGVELSTLDADLDTHIIGLFVDHRNPELVQLTERAAFERRERLVRIRKMLKDLGLDLTAEDVASDMEGGTVGRVHVAEALVKHGMTGSISEAFIRYLGRNRPAYVAKWSPVPEECCRVIHEAGGVAVLAHPGDVVDEQKIGRMVEAGCRAIEAYYPTYSKGLTETYVKVAQKLGVGVSGGSDCHGSRKGRVFIGSISLPMEHVDDLEKRKGPARVER